MGYLTPGMLNQTFDWQQRSGTQDSRGKMTYEYTSVGQITGILSDSSMAEQLRYQQMQHPITHEVAVKGAPQANPGDRLVLGTRHFYVQSVENPGGLNLWTLYKCEERSDS